MTILLSRSSQFLFQVLNKRATLPQYSLLPVLFLFLPGLLWSQNQVVSGTIRDASGNPVSFATILIKGTTLGALASDDGTYTISVPATSSVLVYSYIGYQDHEEIINGRSVIDVVLNESVSMLNEVVLTGYLVQKKSNITGAISSLRNREFRDQPVSNVAQSLQGKVAGINVTTPSGTPGAGLLVSVRGASNPLYVVDGVPMISESNSVLSTSYDTEGQEQGSGQNLSSMADINPDDIESIEVLKDASSAAQYGARAANGVVLITTKRGRSGKTEFSFNSFTGYQKVAREIPFLDSEGLVELIEDARAQDLKLYEKDPSIFPEGFDPALLTNPLPESWYTGVNTNWLEEIFRTAPISNLQLSARGGNDKTRFFVSGNYFDQEGIVIENAFKRGSFRLNLDNKVSDRVTIGFNNSFTYSRNRRSFNDDTYTGVVTNAIGASPLEPVYEEDGSYSDYASYQASWLSDNPVKSAKEITAFTNSYRYLGTAFVDINLAKSLRFHSAFTTDYTNLTDDQFFSALTTDAEAVGGRAIKGLYRNTTWLNENTLTYQADLNENNHLTALAGFSMQSARSNRTAIAAQGFPPGSGLQNISSASSIIGLPSDTYPDYWGIVSFMGIANYDFDNKYLFSASARYDGSSRFDPAGRWGLFPAFSAGWILSREKFFQSKWLSHLKLWASYGLTGDQEIADFQYTSNWGPGIYNGVSGLVPLNIGNPDLTWQRNKMFNIGLDFELWQGKLSGALDYFKGNRTELLTQAVLPATSGFDALTSNAGNIENSGIELSLNAYPVRNTKFTWATSFNFSYLKNEIKSLYTDDEILYAYADLSATHIFKVGESIGSFYGLSYLGVDPATGDPIFDDINSDGIIDDSDQTVLGKAAPDFYGGWTNDFKFNRWDASISTQYSVGNKVYNLIRTTYETLGWSDEGWDENYDLYQVYANNTTSAENRWRNPGDITDIPRASLIFSSIGANSSRFIEDASFFRIRTVNIGYTFKPDNAKWYSSLRFYLQAQNLAVFTKYYGFDPEVSSNGGDAPQTAGVDYAAYPQPRTITFGVNLQF